jgi:hypothetical protein
MNKVFYFLLVFLGQFLALNAQEKGAVSFAESDPVNIYIISKSEVLKKYQLPILSEQKASPLFKPKDEFETAAQYAARLKEADAFTDILIEKFRIKYIESLKEESREKERVIAEKIEKIKKSYQRQKVLLGSIIGTNFSTSNYDAEREIFPVKIFGYSYELKVPLVEARSFKEKLNEVNFQYDTQLKEDGVLRQEFNFKLEHPVTGSVYVLNQKKPLYLDYVNTSASSVKLGIPKINVDVKFIEPSGNNLLDAGEIASLQLTLMNNGEGAATLLKLNNNSTSKNISFEQQKVISEIFPGQTRTVNFSLKADKLIPTDTTKFLISFNEENGFQPLPIEISLGTQAFKPPKIEFIESTIDDGNGNSIIENSEIIKVTALIQNKGQGKANDVRAQIKIDDDNIVLINNSKKSQWIGPLESGESKKIDFEFVVNNNYAGNTKLPINLIIQEQEGVYGAINNIGLEMKQMMVSSSKIKIAGEYDTQKNINEVSLTADVDKNIPSINSVNPKRFALIIGNENYSKRSSGLNSESDVVFAINDAIVFKKYAELTLGIPNDNIQFLSDATSDEMEQAISKLTKLSELSNGDAELFFYYAGHGFPDEESKESYLIPINVTGASVKKGIKLSTLYQDLSKNPAKKITVFLDACFSGGGRVEGLLASRGIKIKPKDEPIKGNLIVFSASTGDQTSLPFQKNNHGMFTYFLLKKLQETKGDLNYADLQTYLKQEVELNSIKYNNKIQNPQVQYSSTVEEIWRKWSFK